ncbi:MAG: PAS domain S-box protein [Anaerolineales bacterium]|nr:PAS domain S-box protein [Anaerolineales bacterium]
MTKQSSSRSTVNQQQPFELLIAHHPFPTWIIHRETLAFLEVNQAAIEAYGYSRAEFLAMTIKDIRPPEDIPRLLELWQRDQSEWRRAEQWRHRRKDGTVIDVKIIAHLITYNGQPANLVTAQDVTAQGQAEARLRQSEARYRHLVEMSPDAVVVHQEGRVIFCNPAANKMMRAGSPEALLGKPITEIVHPDDWPATQDRTQRLLAGETALYPVELRYIRLDGVVIDVEVTAVAITYENKSAVQVIARDISARKENKRRLREADERLRQSEEKFITAFRSSPVPLALTRFDTGRLVEANASFFSFIGYRRDEAMGRTGVELKLITIEQRQFIIETLISQDGAIRNLEMDFRDKEGRTKHCFFSMEQITVEGEALLLSTYTDITELKRAEATLQQKEIFTRGIIDSLTKHLAVLNAKGDIVMVNAAWDQFARDNGLEGQHIFVGANYLDILAQAARQDNDPTIQSVLTGIQAVMSGSQSGFSLAYTGHSPKQPRWFLMRVAPLKNSERGVVITHENITEQVQTNQALQVSEEKYRQLVETSHDLIWAVDGVGRITFINQAARRVYGREPAEMIGRSYTDFSPPHQIKSNEAWAAMIDSDNRIMNYEHWVWHKDGTQVRVNTNAVVQRDRDGTIIATTGTSQDITERNRIEDQLRYQAHLLDSVSDAIIAVDLNFNITVWNRAAERIYGWQASEVTGQRVGEVLPTQMINDTVDGSRSKLLNEGQWQGEVIHTCKDGTERYILSTVTLLKAVDGNTIGAVAVNHDMTERKVLERENEALTMQYHQAQKMESLGRLAGGIAHDFNNLLVPILGYAELGLLAVPPEDALYDNFERISRAAGRAADLTRQILAISRRQVLEMRRLSLNDIITGFQQMLRRIIGEDIAIETYLGADIWPIKADKGQLEQVLLNLAVNARDAMPQGGRLSLETANIMLDETYAATHAETEPGPYTLLAVTDTGCGIDPTIQPHIFEPFFTTKQQGQGTGLGLATVYGIIKQHRGHIWVYSEVTQGTTFKIYLPAVDAAPSTKGDSQRADSALPRGTETVLVVEDEAAVRRLVCDTLAAHGYHVLEAAGPEQGLASAGAFAGQIDLLLTDVIMPKLNGRALYERLLARRPDLRVIYMSGYTDNVIVHHGVVDEGIAFLQKPFSIRRLLEILRQVLE